MPVEPEQQHLPCLVSQSTGAHITKYLLKGGKVPLSLTTSGINACIQPSPTGLPHPCPALPSTGGNRTWSRSWGRFLHVCGHLTHSGVFSKLERVDVTGGAGNLLVHVRSDLVHPGHYRRAPCFRPGAPRTPPLLLGGLPRFDLAISAATGADAPLTRAESNIAAKIRKL